ncbi:MFS transporter [Aquiluna borgnonia]|uniref:MFS transporter n=1 Tax=Aquiluna borgnonia TaxID=2499157 RepID=A0A7D4UI30_9MICO|nr:MFS transporter [Aquiluna borgnonia]QKJ25020.1 MFS transporter [Aquiluna borgnonia]
MSLLRAKIAVSFFFLSGGSALALWAVHIPLIQKTVGIDYSTLGFLLMLSGVGGYAAMQLGGWLIDHIGAKTTTRLGGVIVGLSLLGPAFAGNPITLGLAIVGIGFGLAGIDVPMNAAALQVEKANHRAIFTFFHLFWSVGGLLGAALGYATIGAGFTQSQTLPVYGLLLSVIGFFIASWLLPNEPVASRDNKQANKAASKANRRVLAFVILAGLMSASGAIVEGVAQDWSALYLIDIQNASVSLAAWGLAAFNIGMILGRIFIDRIVEAKGRGFIIRWGSLASAVAIGLQAIAPSYEISLVFWFLLGLGISGVVPQLFAEAGEIGEASHSGRNMAQVVGITYIGGLAGPSIIGLLTNSLELNIAIGWGAVLGIFIVLSYSKLQKLEK